MKRIKGIKTPKVKSKSPGSAPTSTHLKKLKGSGSTPKATHPGENLGKHLYPAKAKGVGPAKKLNVTKRVVADITKTKHMKGAL
jgi:hypothetical protein